MNDLVESKTLNVILDKILTPRFGKLNFQWNGKTMWLNQPSNGIRQVFTYKKLKGETGTFVWGVCIDFVPTVSSNKLQFHKTDKSVKLHLFEWTDEYSNSFLGGILENGITTHWGRQETEKSILKLIDNYEERIYDWFNNSSTIEQLIEVAQKQINQGESYEIHSPNQRFVLAFLQAKLGQLQTSYETIDDLAMEDEIKRKIKMHLKKISQKETSS